MRSIGLVDASGLIKRADREAVVIVIIGLFMGAMLSPILFNWIDPTSQTLASEPRPSHGRVETPTSRARIVPFHIVTPDGSKGYVVKLVEVETGETVMSIFLEAGKTFETRAPVGTFILKWATGETWQGGSQMFGPSALYQEALTPLVFRKNGDGYTGGTLTLSPEIDGNLHSERISPSEF